MGDTDLCPWDMGTFGSLSIRQFGPVLRGAGAEARAVLLQMTAERLNVPVERLHVKDGATPHAYTDWQIASAPGGQVAIVIVGTYEGVRPLIERYRATASEIDYPAPTRWTPDSRPRLDIIKPLLVTFDSAHLTAAAHILRDSPPPERTTPFVAGVLSGLGPPNP